MPWKIRCAFSGFIFSLVFSSPIEYRRLVDSDSSILEKVAIICIWIFTLYALSLVQRRRIWAGRLFAITTGLSMVFLRMNVDWLHKEGFGATSLLAFATVLRFISLSLLVWGKHDGWFVELRPATSQKTARCGRVKTKPRMPALQAVIGVLLGLGVMSIAGQSHWPNAHLVGASFLAVAAILFGVFIWRYRKR
jgi:hypothetical protein